MIHDFAIIGSGFGGAVTACRLAQGGRNVVVLERGRRWLPSDYPRKPDDAWVFDIDAPHRHNGWIDLRIFKGMAVVQGAGVGGGSLIYANVSIDAKQECFASGWPTAITAATLAPYYDRVAEMLKPVVIPDAQETHRTKLLREAAQSVGEIARFRKVPLAVAFDPQERFPDSRPIGETANCSFVNEFGKTQGFCIHCGNCDIGCKVQAKNTLDLNYLAAAETLGAEIRPLAVVSHVISEGESYAVVYDDLTNGERVRRVIRARQVVLAAGSLGTTEILFRSRDVYKTLPNVSSALGRGWSSNGDFLTPAFYKDRKISPTTGPTITGAIDFLDGSDSGRRYFVEDGGFPDVIRNALRGYVRHRPFSRVALKWTKMMTGGLASTYPLENVMPWFGQAVDGGDGALYYGREWLRPWKQRLGLHWNARRSEHGIGGLIEAHKRFSEMTGGKPLVPPTWSILRTLVTPHPLGGCNMAMSSTDGVVDDLGRVFGHPGLYVADASIIPRPIGLNPSKTIAALAERIAENLLV